MAHKVMIQGKYINITMAKITYLCIHCLAKLRVKDFGLKCTANKNHYGFIHRKEAALLTQEERFMKIGEMFKSDYLRGIDVGQPMKLTIKKVTEETARNIRSNQMETEYIMYFEETPKKLRLNVTMAKECAKIINKDNPEVETNNWIGKTVTVYRTTVNAFGEEHIVPRIRKVKSGDKAPGNKARFSTIDDLLYQLHTDFSLTEVEAKSILKECNFNGFTSQKSGDMYDAVKLFIAENREIPTTENEQPELIAQ